MDILYNALLLTLIVLQIVVICALLHRRKPQILMREGRFSHSNMKKCRVTADDIMAAARKKGYFNIGDIDTAVLESDGSISVLPAATKRRLETKDFNIAPVRAGMTEVVYQNGRLDYSRLASLGFTEQKLAEFLQRRGYDIAQVALIVISESGRVDVFS